MNPMGWIHTAFGVAALLAGGVVVLRPKGTARHRLLGWIYVAAMAGLLGTSFLIYRLFGGFGPFHVFAVIGALTLAAGVAAVRRSPRPRGWMARHYHMMGYSYIGLLAATGAEIVTRVPGVAFGPGVAVSSALVLGTGAWVLHRNAGRVLPRVEAERARVAGEGAARRPRTYAAPGQPSP